MLNSNREGNRLNNVLCMLNTKVRGSIPLSSINIHCSDAISVYNFDTLKSRCFYNYKKTLVPYIFDEL